MKISTNSRYAIRFLMRLAADKTNTKQSVASIAEVEGISEKMLERIAAKLKKANFLRSSKGVGGGYELNINAHSITITSILELMETPYLPIHCVPNQDKCVHSWDDCVAATLWTDIDKAIHKVTDEYTIGYLAEKALEQI